MAAFTSKATGNWRRGNRRTWNEAGVPGDGDTVSINAGHVVTVDADTTVGLGGSAGSTAAIATLSDGAVRLAPGVTLTCKGDINNNQRLSNNDYFVMDAGSKLSMDVPAGQSYRIGGAIDFCFGRFRANGTAKNRCSICSKAGRGIAHFSYEPHSFGGSILASHTDFAYMGDAAKPAISIMYQAYEHAFVTYDMQDCTFDRCGAICGYTYWGTDSVCRHKRCVHTNTQHPYCAVSHGFTGPIGKGVRELSYNVFDRRMGNYNNGVLLLEDVTITQNYLADGFAANSASPPWASFSKNFSAGALNVTAPYETLGNVFYESAHGDNPHFVNLGAANGNYSVAGNIFQTNTEWDTGDCILTLPAREDITLTVKNNVTLPNPVGGVAGSLVTFFGNDPHVRMIVEHNTHTSGGEGGVALETGAWTHGNLLSYRNNIIWATSANVAGRFKLMMASYTGTGTADAGVPANIDYNAGFNLLDNDGNPHFRNAHRGYCAPWSVTPGVHDLAVDPRFRDATRNIESFASAYLHKEAEIVWNRSTDYKVGDIVSRRAATVYNNANILYRCMVAHHSSDSKVQPGDPSNKSNWRAKWEPASLYYIRQAIAAGATYTGYGVTNGSVIEILIAWIRDGFTPTNPKLRAAGSDGLDIGAVPMSTEAKANSTAPKSSSKPTHDSGSKDGRLVGFSASLAFMAHSVQSEEPASRRRFLRNAGLMLSMAWRRVVRGIAT